MKQLLNNVRMCSLNVREVHFQNSDGISFGPVALRFLIFLRMNSSSSMVNNWMLMSGGLGEIVVRGMCVSCLEVVGWSIVYWNNDLQGVRLVVLVVGGCRWGP